jgi:hypothetical protein
MRKVFGFKFEKCETFKRKIVVRKSKHGCVKWALLEHLSPPCYDFSGGVLGDCPHINETKIWILLGRSKKRMQRIYFGRTEDV